MQGIGRSSFMSRLLGRNAAPGAPGRSVPATAAPLAVLEAAVYGGHRNLDVVGESHYQEALRAITGSQRGDRVHHDVVAVLVPEADNAHDPNAISVWINGRKVGYLPRELAFLYRPGLLALMEREGRPIALRGFVAGGGTRSDGPGLLGVFLDHDPSDFEIAEEPGDEAEDERIPEWLRRLPDDPIAAVSAVRRLLESEHDTITRHEMYEALEERLYRARDAFASALDEYDAACEAHDLEMPAVRAAILVRDGRLPQLHTYHQMVIRKRKAHDWAGALRWAQRGLELYGDAAAEPAWVDDLRTRAKYVTEKMEAEATTAARREARAARAAVDAAPLPDLVCVSCQRPFPRPSRPGRPPRRCPDCPTPNASPTTDGAQEWRRASP